jgi:hypothetical protein
MITLSFDKLISMGVGNHWVIILGELLAGCVFCLWSGVLMDKDRNMISNSVFDSMLSRCSSTF